MSRRCTATSPVVAAAHSLAVVVDHRNAVARIGPPHAARDRRPLFVRVADDVVDLGLTEHLVDGDAERVAAPVEHRVADRLARAHHRAQLAADNARAARRPTFIIALSAVGNRKVWSRRSAGAARTHVRRVEAAAGSRRSGQPKYSVGSSASISPPVQAQSAGDQNTGDSPAAAVPRAETSSARNEAGQVADQCRSAQSARPWAGRWCRWCRSARPGRRPRVHALETIGGGRQSLAPLPRVAGALANGDQVRAAPGNVPVSPRSRAGRRHR